MTDQYGSNPPHNESAEHDQMAGEHETWTGEAPVDDFHAGEEATVSEEVETHEETSGAQTAPAKKSIALPAIAGIGGILFLGAVLYWQFGMSSSDSGIPAAPPLSMPAPVTENNTAPVAPPTPPTANEATADNAPKAPADVAAPTTALAPVTDATKAVVPPAQPASVSAASSDTTIVALPPKPAAVTVTVAPATPPAAPAVVATAPVAPQVPAAVVAVTQPKDNAVDTQLSSLSNRVEDLQKSLAQTAQQLSQVSNELSNSSGGSNAAIDERLAKIEQKLTQLEGGVSSSSRAHAHTHAVVASDETLPATRTYSKHHSHKSQASLRKATRAKSVKMGSRPRNLELPEMPMTPGQTHWVLRAATPTEAWVASDETSAELKHIQVGDTLSGIGSVQAIHQNGDSWIIEGSKGTIR